MKVEDIIAVITRSLEDYHIHDSVDSKLDNPYYKNSLEAIIYEKTWIDTVQWHLEDIARDLNIIPNTLVTIKRKIDKHNQIRTDLVEKIDDIYYEKYKKVELKNDHKLNTETIGWAIDRLSILCIKIYHMKIESKRDDAGAEHKQNCLIKLNVLLQQKKDLSLAIEQLEAKIQKGEIRNLRYRQMKMYNDPNLNPILYRNTKSNGR